MTPQELLIPRVLAIGTEPGTPNYPDSLFTSGEVLILWNKYYYKQADGISICTVVFCGEGEIPKHIFIKNKYGYCDNKGIFSRFVVEAWFGGKIQEKSPQDLKNIFKKDGWNKQFCLQDTVYIKRVFK